jgi:predicted DNA-binding transcriptional regulator AlpA
MSWHLQRFEVPPMTALPTPTAPDRLVPAIEGAELVGLSLAAFWRGVAAGTFPARFYPAPRAPRWSVAELMAALAATRAKPRDAMAARRAARLGATA